MVTMVFFSHGKCWFLNQLYFHPAEYDSFCRRLRGSSYLGSRYFMFPKRRHFHKNICSRVENELCCPRKVNISTVNFTTKICISQRQYSRTKDSKCLALIAQVVRAFGMNSKVWGLSPSKVEIFSVSKSLIQKSTYDVLQVQYLTQVLKVIWVFFSKRKAEILNQPSAGC